MLENGRVCQDTRKFLSPQPTLRAGCTKKLGDWQEACFGIAVAGRCYLDCGWVEGAAFFRGLVVSDDLLDTKYNSIGGALARGA